MQITYSTTKHQNYQRIKIKTASENFGSKFRNLVVGYILRKNLRDILQGQPRTCTSRYSIYLAAFDISIIYMPAKSLHVHGATPSETTAEEKGCRRSKLQQNKKKEEKQ